MNYRKFLVELLRLLNSLIMWASSDSLGTEMTKDQKTIQERNLAASLEELQNSFRNTVKNTAEELRQALLSCIFGRYDSAVANAAHEATITCERWGKPINKEEREKGGYRWSTYRALCVHEGVYTFQKQLHDWNESLTAPMMRRILPRWGEMFTSRLPQILNSFA